MMSTNSIGILSLMAASLLAFASAQITEEEQQEILRAHNLYRGQVDPIATNMEEMVSAGGEGREGRVVGGVLSTRFEP